MECDVVIVGAGACGILAALSCDAAGLKVILTEKSSTLRSSNFANCGGPAACESSVQTENGVNLSVSQMFKHMYDYFPPCSRRRNVRPQWQNVCSDGQ